MVKMVDAHGICKFDRSYDVSFKAATPECIFAQLLPANASSLCHQLEAGIWVLPAGKI